MTVEAMTPVFSEGSGVGAGREEGAPEGRVVGLKGGTTGENFCLVSFI